MMCYRSTDVIIVRSPKTLAGNHSVVIFVVAVCPLFIILKLSNSAEARGPMKARSSSICLPKSDSKIDVCPGTQRLRVSLLRLSEQAGTGHAGTGTQAQRLDVAGGRFAVSRPRQAWAAAIERLTTGR